MAPDDELWSAIHRLEAGAAVALPVAPQLTNPRTCMRTRPSSATTPVTAAQARVPHSRSSPGRPHRSKGARSSVRMNAWVLCVFSQYTANSLCYIPTGDPVVLAHHERTKGPDAKVRRPDFRGHGKRSAMRTSRYRRASRK